jgi:CDGSH-type Zn-finger protein
MADVKITVRPNGPFRVEGPVDSVELVDATGAAFDLGAKVRDGRLSFSLCRCGGSVNKPFCDGTHSKIGFQGAEAAVRTVDGGSGPSGEPKPVENNPSSSSPAKG